MNYLLALRFTPEVFAIVRAVYAAVLADGKVSKSDAYRAVSVLFTELGDRLNDKAEELDDLVR